MELSLLTDNRTTPLTNWDRGGSLPRAIIDMQELRSRVYFVTPGPSAEQNRVVDLVRMAVAGGAGIVQYCADGENTRRVVQQAVAMLQFTRPARVPLIIGGRVDIALAVGADGVHLGADDMPVAIARRLLGPRAIIGTTVASSADARIAQRDVATYVAVETNGRAVEALSAWWASVREIRRLTPLPVCVMGDMDTEALAAMADDPPDLVAATGAGVRGDDATSSVRELGELIRTTWNLRRPPP